MLHMYIFTHITKLQKIEAELRGIKPNEIKKIKLFESIFNILSNNFCYRLK